MYGTNHFALFRLRLLKLIISLVILFFPIFLFGFEKFAKNYFFFTQWSETLVGVVIFLTLFLAPMTEGRNRFMTNFQHAVVSIQVIVVLTYWGVLYPKLGWACPDNYPNKKLWKFQMCYKHTTPFLCKYLICFFGG
jgi:hypothetical protein